MFDAAQALLQSDGYRPKTHKGVHILLNKHYVKDGRLPKWVGTTLRNGFDSRQLADYSDRPVSEAHAADILRDAERIVQELRKRHTP